MIRNYSKEAMVAMVLFVGFLVVGAMLFVPIATAQTTPTPTPDAGEGGNTTTSELTLQKVLKWASQGKQLTTQQAKRVSEFVDRYRERLSLQKIRVIDSWLQPQLPTPMPTTPTQNETGSSSRFGVQQSSTSTPRILYPVPGSDTYISNIQWQPDQGSALITIHIGVSREVVVVTDIGKSITFDQGAVQIPTKRYVLDNDQGTTFTIRVPATSGQKGIQKLALNFRSGSDPIAVGSGAAEIWERDASHWLAGYALLMGGSLVAAVVYFGRDKYDSYKREF